jgi:hypothetical protein
MLAGTSHGSGNVAQKTWILVANSERLRILRLSDSDETPQEIDLNEGVESGQQVASIAWS